MDFQKVVMAAAVAILILTLAMIGIAMRKQRKNAIYPPVLAECPDYWKGASDGECERGSVYNKGDCPDSTVDFSSMNDCQKYEWANGCQVTWDGISNNPGICDVSS